MDDKNSEKKGLPQELPEELLADVSGGGKYSGKGYKVLDGYYGICEKYQYRYFGEPDYEGEWPDDCLRCRYFRIEATDYPTLYCTYPDDYTRR